MARIFNPLYAILVVAGLANADEILHNGIVLPDEWPPHPEAFARDQPTTPPYLSQPLEIIPINLGRQLFVDDFLIEESTLERTFHQPVWHEDCPIFKPETPAEFHRNKNIPFAAPFSDGVWFDPADGAFKMWYLAGTGIFFGYATSTDGVHWERPNLNVSRLGENILDIEPVIRDSSTVWLDQEEKDSARRFKMMYFRAGLHMRVSPDGINWSDSLGAPGKSSDRCTFYRDPFRKVWVYSIRGGERGVGRCRFYGESPDFGVPLWGSFRELPRWACADSLDRVKDFEYAEVLPDLYNLDATPYESLMLGLFSIHAKETEGARPKINYVTLGFSRDGFHWDRPDRRPFLDVSEDPKAWNYGNVQSAGGGCVIMGDKLYFYCSGRNSGRDPDDGSGGSTGLAILRRDGFASLDAGQDGGKITTRKLRFDGKRLFVNVDASGGDLRAEVIDAEGNPIPPFTLENCQPVTADSTLIEVNWKDADDLTAVAGKPVRLRFHLRKASLYAFWVSQDEAGASQGYVAAGGPGFISQRDDVGRTALQERP
ncbi:MAG: hypothetical protein ACI8UO_001637 [Verrucomicrobiales bacterium]|jgi:hypothetical protein